MARHPPEVVRLPQAPVGIKLPPQMKPCLFLLPLLLVACAPRAILLREAKTTAPQEGPMEATATNPVASEEPLPQRSGDNLGLLEPSNLTQIPDEREMRPTVDPDDEPPVIGTPPVNE